MTELSITTVYNNYNQSYMTIMDCHCIYNQMAMCMGGTV